MTDEQAQDEQGDLSLDPEMVKDLDVDEEDAEQMRGGSYNGSRSRELGTSSRYC
jgi:hypothetical protein